MPADGGYGIPLSVSKVSSRRRAGPAHPVGRRCEDMYERICVFSALYRAHKNARKGKRDHKDVIEFEMNLSENLVTLKEELESGTYRINGYYTFMVHDPKDRAIHALRYRDRVVQHALCDEILAPTLERRLIYDNAACRIGKGTDFALDRTTEFMRILYRRSGPDYWALRFDVRKFFDSIDHEILKQKLFAAFPEEPLRRLLCAIIDSYRVSPGKGLPLGNQTSQWFAIWYLDPLDRLIKEQLGFKYYSRYMDDGVLLHADREYLKNCLAEMRSLAEKDLALEFNEKTQILPIRNGINYLGWHLYLTDTGKVIRKLKTQTKKRASRRIRKLQEDYAAGRVDFNTVRQVMSSYNGHLKHGHTYHLRKKLIYSTSFVRNPNNDSQEE